MTRVEERGPGSGVDRAIVVDGPGEIAVREVAAVDGPVRLATVCSGVSAGTELSFLTGAHPALHAHHDPELGLFRTDVPATGYPVMRLGYMEVARVVSNEGPGPTPGTLVAAAYGHRTGYRLDPLTERMVVLPEGLDPLLGIYVAHMGPICANGLLHAAADLCGTDVRTLGDGVRGRRVAVVGGNGRTGRAVCDALRGRGAEPVPSGRAEWDDLAKVMTGCAAAYLIAPNFHPDEPGYVAHALDAARAAGVARVGYHSVASPYVPAMPHHLGKAAAEDLVRRSGLRWTILQPGVYVENFDLTRTVHLPYRADAVFGFVRLVDLGAAAAEVLLGAGHEGATYELASMQGSVADLARGAGVDVVEESADPRTPEGLSAMYAYYDDHGLPAGVLPLRALLAERGAT